MPDDAAFTKDEIKVNNNNNSLARIIAILSVIVYH